jgi:hypothetical protein
MPYGQVYFEVCFQELSVCHIMFEQHCEFVGGPSRLGGACCFHIAAGNNVISGRS